jgi:integrase
MTTLTGLFSRGSSYYLRVVLPRNHPDTHRYRSGKVVLSLGSCGKRDAINKGTILRAQVLRGEHRPDHEPIGHRPAPPVVRPLVSMCLRDVFDKWVEARPRSADTIAACRRALVLFEEQTGNPPLAILNRAAGIAFRTWLQHPDRGTTSKTARDRLTWVKSLLKHAQIDLEVLPRSPWEGLDIEQSTTHRRRPWTLNELSTLLNQPLHTNYALPSDTKAGADAAYWIPLLGLYTGARISELVQLRHCDIERVGDVYVLSITDQGEDQRLKTSASARKVPIHSELIRLGFLQYVERTAAKSETLWPLVPLREGRVGGFFSQWFGGYRRGLGLGKYPDFHCFRHTVRSALSNADIAEPIIDMLVGHEVKGSTGAKVYTHRTAAQMQCAIERIAYPELHLGRVFR